MPKRQDEGREPTLEELGIYLDVLSDAQSCPEQLRDLFQLVQDVAHLRFHSFARGHADNANTVQIQPRIVDAYEYDRLLKRRAAKLMVKSTDQSLVDAHEFEWISQLEPLVLRQFDRIEEELSVYHCCFICRRFHAPNSRPLINPKSARLREQNGVYVPNGDLELCKSPDKHLNLPNFTKAREVPFLKFNASTDDVEGNNPSEDVQPRQRATHKAKGERFRRADVTIGLSTYNVNQECWRTREDLWEDDRVQLFDRAFLRKVEDRFDIRQPYNVNGKRSINELPAFAFAVWEAKSMVASDNHHTASFQTAEKLQTLLLCQQKLFKRSSMRGFPLVWHFTSVGSSWTVYGCYLRHVSHGNEDHCIVTKLWVGDSGIEEQALQLLYIVDIIAIWAEYTHKPLIGSCLSNLRAELDGKEKSLYPLIMQSSLDVNRTNFPWLLDEDWNMKNLSKSQGNGLLPPAPRSNARSRSHSRSSSSMSSLCIPRSRHSGRGLREAYLAPELHNYVWILDQDPGLVDLIVIRIDRQGHILPPVVIFNSDEWGSDDFVQILTREQERRHPDVEVDFVFNDTYEHYLRRLVRRSLHILSPCGVQFCAILPLDRDVYEKQCARLTVENNVFARFRILLQIRRLLSVAGKEYETWCTCHRPFNEYSPPMILCDNVNCQTQWYHMECVGLDEDFDYEDWLWLCPECEQVPPDGVLLSAYSDVVSEDVITEATDARVHRTRTLASVWEAHPWPSPEKVLELFDKLSYQVNVDTTVHYEISRDGNTGGHVPQGSWAVSRASPKQMIHVQPLELNSHPLI